MSTLSLFGIDHYAIADSTDAQNTPRDLAMDLGVFGIDPCSNPRSHIQSLKRCQLEDGQDGLASEWGFGGIPCSVFVNGPYSDPLPWCQRLAAHQAPWAALWKLDSTTAWFSLLVRAADAWAPFKKRLQFERAGNVGSADFPSMLAWGRGFEPSSAVLQRLWTPRSER